MALVPGNLSAVQDLRAEMVSFLTQICSTERRSRAEIGRSHYASVAYQRRLQGICSLEPISAHLAAPTPPLARLHWLPRPSPAAIPPIPWGLKRWAAWHSSRV